MEVNKVLKELEQLIANKSWLQSSGVMAIDVEHLWHFITAHVVQPEDGLGGLA